MTIKSLSTHGCKLRRKIPFGDQRLSVATIDEYGDNFKGDILPTDEGTMECEVFSDNVFGTASISVFEEFIRRVKELHRTREDIWT